MLFTDRDMFSEKMLKVIVLALVFLSMTQNGDCESLVNDNGDLAAAKSNSINLNREETSKSEGENASKEPIAMWNEILASAIVLKVKQMFQATPEPANPLRVDVSPLVSFFGQILQVHRDIVYGRDHQRIQAVDPANELDPPVVNPKDEVEMVHPDILMGKSCTDGNCGSDSSTAGHCSPGEYLDTRGLCVPISDENPSKYLVRVPHQCPEGYRAHRGVCHLVW